MQKEEFFLPSNDYMFKRIFAVDDGAVVRLKVLICEILSLNPGDVEEVIIKNPEILPEMLSNRSVRLDVHAFLKLYGQTEIINVEMQRVTSKSMFDRALYHWALIHQNALLSAESFGEIKKTVAIWLLSENIDQSERYHRIAKTMDTETYEVISDKMELHFIELDKIKFAPSDVGKLYLKALALKSKEEFNMLESTINTPEMQDLAYRIKGFNKDLEAREFLRQRRDELLYEYEMKQLRKETAKQIENSMKEIENSKKEIENSKKEIENSKKEKTLIRHIKFVAIELYKGIIAIPDFVKEKSGGTCTPTDFFVVAAKSTAVSVIEISRVISNEITKIIELGGTIEYIASEVEADPQAVQAFYDKYKSD